MRISLALGAPCRGFSRAVRHCRVASSSSPARSGGRCAAAAKKAEQDAAKAKAAPTLEFTQADLARVESRPRAHGFRVRRCSRCTGHGQGKVPGEVRELAVREGRQVRAGQPLAASTPSISRRSSSSDRRAGERESAVGARREDEAMNKQRCRRSSSRRMRSTAANRAKRREGS